MKTRVDKILRLMAVALVSTLMINISGYVYANTNSKTNNLYSDSNILNMYDVSKNIKNTPLETLEVTEYDFIKLQNQIHENYSFVNINKKTIDKKTISTKNNEVYYSISYKLIGETVDSNSNVNFLYNKDLELISTQYSVAIDHGNGDIQASVYNDNFKIYEINTEKNKKTNKDNVTSVIKFSENGDKQNITSSVISSKSFWSCFNSCLSNQGVASWVVLNNKCCMWIRLC